MEITREFLKEHGVCESGYRWWIKNCEGLPLFEQLEKIKNKNIKWFFWTIVRLMTKYHRKEFIIFAARKVLPIFEKEFPGNKISREALEAAEKCFENTTEENKNSAYAASAAAYAAAFAAASAASYAASAASDAAYNAYVADAELKDEIVKYGIELLK